MSLSFSAEVALPKTPSDSSFRAFARLIVGGVVVIDGFRVMEGKYGLFVNPPSEKSNKTDENGRNVWFDKVRFIEDVPEGQRRGPVAEEAFKAILDAYTTAVSSSGGADRPAPTNERPTTPASAGPPRW